jgi:hypothetical protein
MVHINAKRQSLPAWIDKTSACPLASSRLTSPPLNLVNELTRQRGVI